MENTKIHAVYFQQPCNITKMQQSKSIIHGTTKR